MSTFGYRSDPRTRTASDGSEIDLIALDSKYDSGLRPFLATASAGEVDLSRFCTDQNQGSLSSCVGNGTVEAVEILNNIAGYKPTPLSRMFVYAMARNEEEDSENPGHTMLEKDEGTYIRNAFDVLSRYGVCDEYLWPYLTDKVFTSPSLMAQRQALGHKIHSYYRIDATGNDRLDQIVSALRQNHPVVFGTKVTAAFQKLQGTGKLSLPTDPTIGGHCMVVVGYMAGLFLIHNSWGKNWGEEGFCLFRPEYLAWEETQDLWVPTLGMDFSS